jgi:phage terminase large subunit-like protein
LTSVSPSSSAKREYLRLLTEKRRRARLKKLWTYYPDAGPLRRELYGKHMEFFRRGLDYEERCMLAANRVGKTESVGGYELTLHLTGLYPEWWPGFRFHRPIRAWAAGDTGQTTRDIIQGKLLGPPDDRGAGLIPGACLGRTRPKSGIADAIDTAQVRHVSGGWSRLGFKSYDQGRRAFQGVEQDVIWLDEEPPFDVYNECLIRTAATTPGVRGGMILCTFTALEGLSETVLYFMPGGELPGDAPP